MEMGGYSMANMDNTRFTLHSIVQISLLFLFSRTTVLSLLPVFLKVSPLKSFECIIKFSRNHYGSRAEINEKIA